MIARSQDGFVDLCSATPKCAHRAWMHALAVIMTPEDHSLGVPVAELPDIVRGYEDVKLANVALYRKQVETLSKRSVAFHPGNCSTYSSLNSEHA